VSLGSGVTVSNIALGPEPCRGRTCWRRRNWASLNAW